MIQEGGLPDGRTDFLSRLKSRVPNPLKTMKITFLEARNILTYNSHIENAGEDELIAEAYTMGIRALEIVEEIPRLKKAFPESIVLDDILATMEKKGFDINPQPIIRTTAKFLRPL